MKRTLKAAGIVGLSAAALMMGGGPAYASSPSATVISTEADPSTGTSRAIVRLTGFPSSADIQLVQCATSSERQLVCSDDIVDAQTDEVGTATQSIAVPRTFTGFDSETSEAVEVDCTSAGTNCFIMSVAFGEDSSLNRADAVLDAIWN